MSSLDKRLKDAKYAIERFNQLLLKPEFDDIDDAIVFYDGLQSHLKKELGLMTIMSAMEYGVSPAAFHRKLTGLPNAVVPPPDSADTDGGAR